MKIELTSEIWREGDMYTAYCHELEVATAGRTIEEAKRNLVEAIEIFFEETARLGTLGDLLEEAGVSLESADPQSARAAFCVLEKVSVPQTWAH